jgi:hypothetical protein
VLSRPK